MENKHIDNAFVALLDILGFKQLAYNNSHTALIEIYNIFHRAIRNEVETIINSKKRPDVSKTVIHSITISDSVVLWTENSGINDFYHLVFIIRDLLFHGFFMGLPLRGALTFGALSYNYENIDSDPKNHISTVFGRSIVDAYEATNNQNWSGAVITNEAIKEYEYKLNRKVRTLDDPFMIYEPQSLHKRFSLNELINRKVIRKWRVPMKSKESPLLYTIDWVNTKRPKFDSESIRSSFYKHNKLLNENPTVEEKIINTIKYCNSAV